MERSSPMPTLASVPIICSRTPEVFNALLQILDDGLHQGNDSLLAGLGAFLFTQGNGLGHEDAVFTDVAPAERQGFPRSQAREGDQRDQSLVSS